MKKALVVGIDAYPLSPLTGCVNDATAFTTIMETDGGGAPNFEIRQCNNVQTKGELKGLIKELFNDDNETTLFYFSGHGYIDDVGGYIVTPDYQENDFGVSMNEILTIANASKSKNKIIILDCCTSGAFGTQGENGVATIAEGVSILTSSEANEPSEEINGHGIFTDLLLQALQGGAANITGQITPGSVYAFIDQALGAWEQRPIFKTNIKRFISLRNVDPQVPLETLRKIAKYFPTPQQEFKLDPSFEDTNDKVVEHTIIEPHANKVNTMVFKDLQKLQSVGLVVPVGEAYMYYAAMHSTSCRLTALGNHYWRLANEKRLR